MGGLPVEMITMLGSSLLGGFMSIWGQSIKAKQAEQKMLLARGKFQMAEIDKARRYENTGFQWTRRIIALTAIFAIVLLPKVVVIFYPDIEVTVGYLQFKPGFLFVAEKEVLKWISFTGLVITPLDTNLVAAIVGMYFGGSLVRR